MATVLVACEFSGIVRDAFIRAGHDAISVDLDPSESDFGPHHQGDVLAFLDDHAAEFDIIIAHPPCVYLANSGVQWLYQHDTYEFDEERMEKMREGANFFNQFKSQAPMVAIENPLPHQYASKLIGPYTQRIQPYQFGDPHTKAVHLWLEGLPKLKPTSDMSKHDAVATSHNMWPRSGRDRRKERSRFFPGIAQAMAEQWGKIASMKGY